MERLIRSVRRDCLDHVIILGERHLRAILKRNDGYGLDQVVVTARVVTVHPPGSSTETPPGASWGVCPATGAPFPVPKISTGRELLINSLQEQLYAERERNKHLKGA